MSGTPKSLRADSFGPPKRQLDPFAATTQKKLKLKGDFAKISRWYVPFNRLFDLWTAVGIE